MRVLMIHNYYQFKGGEDIVFNAEKKLLKEHGHEVIEYLRNNHEVTTKGEFLTSLEALWSTKSYRDLKELIRQTNPDIAHFHNTFFMVSPSAYYACHDSGVPVVQTLHNFRLLCPAATLLRNNRVCEDCVTKKFQWPGIVHGCWQQSRSRSGLVAAMNRLHHLFGTWETKVDRYIVLTDFCRQKFLEGGLPKEKIIVKPNFLTHSITPSTKAGSYALFIGRISTEKGLDLLLQAWKDLPEIPLKVVGDGPLLGEMKSLIISEKLHNIEFIGPKKHDETLEIIRNARFVVIPSKWYETFSLVVIESFSLGIPVIVPDSENFACLVKNKVTGLCFKNADMTDLKEKIVWAWKQLYEMNRMAQTAREEYLQKYTPESNYQQIMHIYDDVMVNSKRSR